MSSSNNRLSRPIPLHQMTGADHFGRRLILNRRHRKALKSKTRRQRQNEEKQGKDTS